MGDSRQRETRQPEDVNCPWRRVFKQQQGITLLEVLFVMVLVAGAVFLVLIKIPLDLQEERLEASAGHLVDNLREIQQAALEESRTYKATFFAADAMYTVGPAEDMSLRKTVYLDEGVQFAGSPKEVSFNGNGTLGAGSQTIPLICGGHEIQVIIAPNFGRIRTVKIK